MTTDSVQKIGALKYQELTDHVLCCFYNVYNRLGYGFLEKVYENALMVELRKSGLASRAQCPIKVHYDGYIVGEYIADIMVDDKIMVEVKASRSLMPGHEAQLLNYLKATEIEVGLLLNFGPKPEIKRKIFDNDKKWFNQ
ncbi:GxxExxY protein [Trichloromonas sp.]|uniref:GxxExxY protein n=1 Tax=Trichloromonas sp. TaxID=3069249 RepID=UPI002A446F1B|nr:GxxExxY protein [Trichloromonas sp.]